MEGRVIDGTASPATIHDSGLNVVYREEHSGDADNNSKEPSPGNNNQEYILVTVDENQSIDSILSNLNEHLQLHPHLSREFIVVNVEDSAIPASSDLLDRGREEEEKEEVVKEEPSPEVAWMSGSDGESRVISDDDEGAENSLSESQVIYVNSEGVVSSEPTDQYIVWDPSSAKIVDDEVQYAPPPVEYTLVLDDADAPAAEETPPSPPQQLSFDPNPAPTTTTTFLNKLAADRVSSQTKPASRRKQSELRRIEAIKSNYPEWKIMEYRGNSWKRERPLKRKMATSSVEQQRQQQQRQLTEVAVGEQTDDVQCTLCKAYTFDLKSHLKLHCDVCNVFLKEPELLEAHKLNHENSLGHCSCGICGLKFDSSEQLRGHLQINGYHRNLINQASVRREPEKRTTPSL